MGFILIYILSADHPTSTGKSNLGRWGKQSLANNLTVLSLRYDGPLPFSAWVGFGGGGRPGAPRRVPWAPLLVVLGPPPPISGGGQYEDSWDTHWTWEGRMAQMTWRGWARGQPDNATSDLEGKRPGQGGRRVQPARRPRLRRRRRRRRRRERRGRGLGERRAAARGGCGGGGVAAGARGDMTRADGRGAVRALG